MTYYENHGLMYGGGHYERKGAHKLSRKSKKLIFGKKITKTKLKKMLASVKNTTYPNDVLPSVFCPKCGCSVIVSTGNMTSYPEIYEKSFCGRCGFLVMLADNSPEYHCLEFPEDNYML